jgi:hypothetical protein
MFQSSALRLSEHQRPLWLLVALSVLLLALVSVTVAEAASPMRLIGTLQRDLGALRVQLEQIEPWESEGGRRTAAFNADLGDGGPTFRLLSMVTVARAASRHSEALVATYRAGRDHERARIADSLRLDMAELAQRIERLSRPATAAANTALLGEVSAVLTRLETTLAQLSPAPQPRISG